MTGTPHKTTGAFGALMQLDAKHQKMRNISTVQPLSITTQNNVTKFNNDDILTINVTGDTDPEIVLHKELLKHLSPEEVRQLIINTLLKKMDRLDRV
jgi:hypothetical protein